MKIVIIIVIAILLIGGGAAASVYFHVGPLPKLLHMEGAAAAPPPAPPPPRHQEISVGSFLIPVVQNHAITRSVGLDIAVDVLATDATRANDLLPLLQNAFNLDLYQLVLRYSDVNSAADKKAIHDSLTKTAQRVLGADIVKDVVIKSIYER